MEVRRLYHLLLCSVMCAEGREVTRYVHILGWEVCKEEY